MRRTIVLLGVAASACCFGSCRPGVSEVSVSGGSHAAIEDLGFWVDHGALDQVERFWVLPDGRVAYSLWNPAVAARKTWARAGTVGHVEDVPLDWRYWSIELTGMNRKGIMVGNASAENGYGRGFVKDGTKVLWLEGPDESYEWTTARGVSESGLVVGAAISKEGKWRGCIWKDGKARLLPAVEGIPGSGSSIDSHGLVMALYVSPSGDQSITPITEGKIGKSIPLGLWRQFTYLFSNDRGETAGDAVNQSDRFAWAPHSVVMIKDGAVHDLGRLPESHMRVRGISPEGVIFGDARRTLGPGTLLRAFIWDGKHGLTDLNKLLPADSGWALYEAHGVDAKGRVFGIGQLNGQRRFFRLTLPAGS